MAVRSAISWTDATWNPIRGCTRVSPGCGGPGAQGGCYAEGIAARFSGTGQAYEGIAEMRGGKPRWTGKLAFVEHLLDLPLRRRKPTTWFVNSMSDLFHERVPDAWIDRVFAVMALCPQHTFQVLTKRSARMRTYLTGPLAKKRIALAVRSIRLSGIYVHAGSVIEERAYFIETGFFWPLPNVWLGISAEDQIRADERVPDLLGTPAALRIVSAEPLLAPIDFARIDPGAGKLPIDALHAGRTTEHGLDQIIVGDESGPQRRECDLAWVRSIRDQCAGTGTAFFLKQLHISGRKVELPELDGRTWAEMPGGSGLGRVEHNTFREERA